MILRKENIKVETPEATLDRRVGVWWTAAKNQNQSVPPAMFEEIEEKILQIFADKKISVVNAKIILNEITERLQFQSIHTD